LPLSHRSVAAIASPQTPLPLHPAPTEEEARREEEEERGEKKGDKGEERERAQCIVDLAESRIR